MCINVQVYCVCVCAVLVLKCTSSWLGNARRLMIELIRQNNRKHLLLVVFIIRLLLYYSGPHTWIIQTVWFRSHELRINSHNLWICGHVLLINFLILVKLWSCFTNLFPCFNLIKQWPQITYSLMEEWINKSREQISPPHTSIHTGLRTFLSY